MEYVCIQARQMRDLVRAMKDKAGSFMDGLSMVIDALPDEGVDFEIHIHGDVAITNRPDYYEDDGGED